MNDFSLRSLIPYGILVTSACDLMMVWKLLLLLLAGFSKNSHEEPGEDVNRAWCGCCYLKFQLI